MTDPDRGECGGDLRGTGQPQERAHVHLRDGGKGLRRPGPAVGVLGAVRDGAVPIRSLVEDKIVGILAMEVNLKRLWDEVLSFKIGRGVPLPGQPERPAARPPGLEPRPGPEGPVQRRGRAAILECGGRGQASQGIRYRNYQGTEVLGVYRRMEKLGWGISSSRRRRMPSQPSTG